MIFDAINILFITIGTFMSIYEWVSLFSLLEN